MGGGSSSGAPGLGRRGAGGGGRRHSRADSGHGWAAVGSQLVALEDHVRKANPARYSSLVLPNAGEPANAPMSRAMSGGPQDRISQAILTQVGALLKANAPNGPFRGMKVRCLVMGGASQTGGTTLRYIEQSHAAARTPAGGPIYDGYLPMEALAERPVPATDAVIVHAVTEGDLIFTRALGRNIALRPDSDAPNDRYRHYQFTAASHVGTRGITDPLTVFSTLQGGVKPGEHLSQFPAAEMMAPAVENFIAWLMQGVTPPRAAVIETVNGEIVRDDFGNAKGGVRSAYVDVPTVRYIASAPIAPGDNPFRRLIGLEEPFSPEKLRGLYGTREAYLARFGTSIDRMVQGRFLLSQDAGKLKADEAKRPLF